MSAPIFACQGGPPAWDARPGRTARRQVGVGASRAPFRCPGTRAGGRRRESRGGEDARSHCLRPCRARRFAPKARDADVLPVPRGGRLPRVTGRVGCFPTQFTTRPVGPKMALCFQPTPIPAPAHTGAVRGAIFSILLTTGRSGAVAGAPVCTGCTPGTYYPYQGPYLPSLPTIPTLLSYYPYYPYILSLPRPVGPVGHCHPSGRTDCPLIDSLQRLSFNGQSVTRSCDGPSLLDRSRSRPALDPLSKRSRVVVSPSAGISPLALSASLFPIEAFSELSLLVGTIKYSRHLTAKPIQTRAEGNSASLCSLCKEGTYSDSAGE